MNKHQIFALNVLWVIVVIGSLSSLADNSTLENSSVIENSSVLPIMNETVPVIEEPVSIVENLTKNITEQVFVPVESFEVVSITPKAAEKGDVLVTISVKNTGNVELKNLIPIVIGRGFATYNAVPLKSLAVNATGKLIVNGRFADTGTILLTMRIGDELFYDSINITVPQAEIDLEKQKDDAEKKRLADEKAKQDLLDSYDKQLANLTEEYNALDERYISIKEDYDVSEITLTDLKKMIMAAQAAVASGNVDQAKINMIQATTEYKDQKNKIENAKKRPLLAKIKDNIVIISAIAGAFITLLTLYEILKKKKDSLYERIKEVKVSDDTKIVVEQKKSSRKKKK
ncbi:hypothetical protein COV93_02675 [Candidatus Woesearchaeota archaeon CG11_big_fil_rev_8_21_14_0_20_43_8]|nr:MAG: hypothetical protein COV93_02675 [Candidatus Woesearchaeota archaeon CG11_big_fil_rev_8_21_14_0_20_43_8]PIO07086.1 MAG: hypothetical protein COT47_01530 [Candidatus Woesearchaeota archaeon CG08_land_8_20_14_0_20_43_7]